ncbi:MAG TPA: hypothetical protein VHR66_25050 [Gemmataceae bacterium]|jgi:hypothetical protein|nr:hypothetical protein [Gemmataceae bacterium]
MARPTKPLPVFEAIFDGPGLLPETIPLGTLTQALSAIRRLAAGAVETDEGDDEDGDELDEPTSAIRLLDVVRGSAVYRFVCPKDDGAVGNLKWAGKALANPEELVEQDYILNPMEQLSATAKRLGCRIILKRAGSKNGVLATIEPESYNRLSDRIFITGDTSFTGRVQRVGGATSMRCALRVSFQPKLLFCLVESEEVSRQLGELLYREVAVQGEARWIKNTWKVVRFKIKSVVKLDRKPISEAFQELHKLGGYGWDDVDDPKRELAEACGA